MMRYSHKFMHTGRTSEPFHGDDDPEGEKVRMRDLYVTDTRKFNN